MTSADTFLRQLRKDAQAALDPDASSIDEELKSLDWQLGEIGRVIGEIESSSQEASVKYLVKQARRYLDTAVARSHRAQQIDSGLRVIKA